MLCGESMEKSVLAEHLASSCPLRKQSCEFCELSYPAMNFEEHQAVCGSRTDKCDICGERVMLKVMESHVRACSHMMSMCNKYVLSQSGPFAAQVEPVDPYWKQVRYLLFQMWGMKDGPPSGWPERALATTR